VGVERSLQLDSDSVRDAIGEIQQVLVLKELAQEVLAAYRAMRQA
jgi:hypothetical protein